jgi:transposase
VSNSAQVTQPEVLLLLPEVPPAGILFGRGLRLIRDAGTERWAVCLGGLVLDSWVDGDVASQRLAIARLVNGQLARAVEIAQVFGVHRNTVGRIARDVEAGGAVAVIHRKPGPRRRHKVTARALGVLREAIAHGWTIADSQTAVRRRTGVELSRSHVHKLLQQLRHEQPHTLPLDLPAPAATETAGQVEEPSSVVTTAEGVQDGDSAVEPPDESSLAGALAGLAPGQTVTSRYLGLTLFYPALQVVGLLEQAAEVYRLAGTLRFGVQQVFTQLFCLALLQEPTVERVKHVLRGDLGAVMGCGRAACVKTLRRKLALLSAQRQAVRLGTLLARHWLEVGVLNASYLYVDSHVKVYSGARAVSEVWNSQRRMPLPGIVQYFVNDLHGRPLLVVTDDVRGNLAKSLPAVIAAVRTVVGAGRFTVIFDRGGYDGKLFNWLVGQGLDFITYQRGEVHLTDQQFMRREVRWEGRRVRFQLAEDRVKVGDSGPWRRIVIRATDEHQTPILTSLDAATLSAARVTAYMLARWRQENFFKYARAHLGLDVLATYAAETAVDRDIPNPAVKAATADLKRLRASAQKLRAALGRALVLTLTQPIESTAQPAETAAPAAGPGEQPPAGTSDRPAEMTEEHPPPAPRSKRSPRLPPATRDALLGELQTIEVQIEQTRAQLRSLPARVELSTVGPLPQTPQLETKLIADVVKVAAYNAQSWLADLLVRHYPNANDRHDLLRSFARLSGTLTRQMDGGLRIDLEPPDTPLHGRALAGLCADLNQLRPVVPGTDITVRYALAGTQPTVNGRHVGSRA